MNKIRITIIISILVFSVLLSKNTNQIEIKSIQFNSEDIIDDWKYPGKYSPYNLFDYSTSTCFAYKNNQIQGIHIKFKNVINIDRIGILNGYARTKWLYRANARAKKLKVYLTYAKSDNELLIKKYFHLKDTSKLQFFDFKNSCKFNYLSIYFKESYQGKIYSDICITAIKFYLGNKEYTINDVKAIKKDFILSKTKEINRMLTENYFEWQGCHHCNGYFLYFNRDGTIAFKGIIYKADTRRPDKVIKNTKKWKVSDGVLYFKVYDKWYKVKFLDKSHALYFKKIGPYKLNNQYFIKIKKKE